MWERQKQKEQLRRETKEKGRERTRISPEEESVCSFPGKVRTKRERYISLLKSFREGEIVGREIGSISVV